MHHTTHICSSLLYYIIYYVSHTLFFLLFNEIVFAEMTSHLRTNLLIFVSSKTKLKY